MRQVLAFLASLFVSVVLGIPAAALVALVVGAFLALRRVMAWDAAVLAAAAYVTLGATCTGLIAGLAGVPLLGSRWWSLLVLIVWATALLVLTRRTDSRREPFHRNQWFAWIPFASALTAAGLHMISDTFAERWVAISTDPAAHAWMVKEIQTTGQMDFSTNYPQGLHCLAAFAETIAGQQPNVAAQLQTMAVLAFLALSVLALALTSVTLRIASPLGLRTAAWCGFASGVAVLAMDSFVRQLVVPTAHSTILGASLLFLPILLVRDARTAPSSRAALLVSTVLVGLETNLWPPLALPAAVLALAIGAHRLRTRHDSPVTRRELIEFFAAAALSVGLVAAPAAQLLQNSEGAALPGPFYLPQRLLPVLCASGVAWALMRARRSAQESLVAWTLVGLAAMWLAVLVSTGSPTDLQQYYPMKCLWLLIVATLPSGFTGLVTLCRSGWHRLTVATASLGERGKLVRGVVAVALAFGALVALGRDIWQYQASAVQVATPFRETDAGQVSTLRIRLATTWAERFAPRRTVAISLPFNRQLQGLAAPQVPMIIRVITSQPLISGSLRRVCEQIRLTDGDHGAVVVTGAAPTLVESQMRHEGCAGAAPVVHAAE